MATTKPRGWLGGKRHLKIPSVVDANLPAEVRYSLDARRATARTLLNYGRSQITAMSLTVRKELVLPPSDRAEREFNIYPARCARFSGGRLDSREDFGQDHLLVPHPAQLKADLHR